MIVQSLWEIIFVFIFIKAYSTYYIPGTFPNTLHVTELLNVRAEI